MHKFKVFGYFSLSLVLCFSFLFSLSASAEETAQIKSDVITDDVVSSVGQAGISPLSTTTATYWSSADISNILSYVNSIKSDVALMRPWLSNINSYIGHLATIANRTSDLVNRLTVVGGTLHTWLNNGFEFLGGKLDSLAVSVEGNGLGFPDGETFYSEFMNGWYDYAGEHTDFVGAISGLATDTYNIRDRMGGLYYLLNQLSSNFSIYSSNFSTYSDNFDSYSSEFSGYRADFTDVFISGDYYYDKELGEDLQFSSLMSKLLSNSFDIAKLTGSKWWTLAHNTGLYYIPDALNSQNDLASLSVRGYKEDNILSRLLPLFYMQNDLARLTYVLADPTTIELKKSQEGNEQAVVDNFTGDKGVQADNIGDMSGVGDSLGSLTDTGVSVGDGFAQINKSWGFFSQETASQLHNVSASVSDEDDDFVYFYDPNNQGLFDYLGQLREGE